MWKGVKILWKCFQGWPRSGSQKIINIEQGQERKSSMLTKVRIAFGGHIQVVFFSNESFFWKDFSLDKGFFTNERVPIKGGEIRSKWMRYKKRSESGNNGGKYVKVRNKKIYGCYIRKGGELRKICKCYKKRR